VGAAVTDAGSPVVLAEKLLALFDEAMLATTYKPALLLALIAECQQRASERVQAGSVAVRGLARRVVELYWPQTLIYPTTGAVLNQGKPQARIVRCLVDYRRARRAEARSTLVGMQARRAWERLLDEAERTLAQMPVRRLQEPFERLARTAPHRRGRRWRPSSPRSRSLRRRGTRDGGEAGGPAWGRGPGCSGAPSC
jgi:hypothetical protein